MRRMSHNKLCALAGISRSRLNAIESGEAGGIHVVTLMRIAAVFETTPDCLLGLSLDRPLTPEAAAALTRTLKTKNKKKRD